MEVQNINITSLLSQSSLSSKQKESISLKLNNILNVLETINAEKNTKNIEIEENILNKEIKLVAKTIVKRSNQFQKEIIESTLKKKEESIEMLEISKLRIEAEIKDLQNKKNALSVKTKNNFFFNIKNKLSKLFNLKFNEKRTNPDIELETTLKDYNLKLSNYDLEKDKISKNFYENGSTKLDLIRKQTYCALASSKATITNDSIKSIKEKLKSL